MSAPLKVPLTNLKDEGERPFSGAAPSADFPDALTEGALVGDVSVEGVVRAVDDDAVFEGAAKGRWRFDCSRCLKPVEEGWTFPVEGTAAIGLGWLDLTDEVRQSIGLAQPLKIFCKPDCKGLCAVCRGDLNLKDCGHKVEVPPPSPRTRLTIRPKKG